MTNSHSDALVFFGATGDLAYKKIFPALQAMLKRGHLNVPVIGVAKAGWTLEQFKARAHDSLEKHGGVDSAAFEKLSSLAPLRRRRLQRSRHVSGACARNSNGAQAASALPRDSADAVRNRCSSNLEHRGCTSEARIIVEKPFGHDLASAQHLNKSPSAKVRRESAIFRIDHYLGKRPVNNMVVFRFANASWSRSGTATMSRACRSRWPRISASRAAALSTIRPARSAT